MEQNKEFNIIKPSTYWKDSSCYRVLNSASSISNSINYAEEDLNYEDENPYQDEAECELNSDIYVEYLSPSRYKSSIAVASSYLPFLIGTRGATKHRIENETYTKIIVPFKGHVGDVIVTGKDKKSVRQAIIRLEIIVNSAKKKLPSTHFIAIPLNHESIQQRFLEFKKEVLEKCGTDRGVEESIFLGPMKLHLTACVMVLADDRERKEAVRAFEECHQQIMEEYVCGDPVNVELQGIEYMNDDPAEVNVLYAKVCSASWSRSFQDMVNAIVDKMVKAGIVNRERENVTLHMTLMNTKYRPNENATRDKDNKTKITFDARRILKEFKEFHFGEMVITELHLSLRHSVSTEGFYSSSRTLSLIP